MHPESGFVTSRGGLSGAAIDLVLASQGLVPVHGGGYVLIREFKALQRALNHRCAKVSWERAAEFEFRAAAESFFASPVAPVAAHAHAVQREAGGGDDGTLVDSDTRLVGDLDAHGAYRPRRWFPRRAPGP